MGVAKDYLGSISLDSDHCNQLKKERCGKRSQWKNEDSDKRGAGTHEGILVLTFELLTWEKKWLIVTFDLLTRGKKYGSEDRNFGNRQGNDLERKKNVVQSL